MNYSHPGYLLILICLLGENTVEANRRSRFIRRRKAVDPKKQQYSSNGWGVHAPDPEFVGHIQSTTVIAGKDAILRCIVENLGEHKVAWQAVETKQPLSIATNVFVDKNRIQVTTSNSTAWFLQIRNVSQSDTGYYACQISTNPIKSQAGFLAVVEPPEFATNLTNRNLTVMENANVTLSCRAKGNPNPVITWKREDTQKFAVDGHLYDEYKGAELRLFGVSRNHMGAYLCVASNDVPPAISRRIYLDVRFPPLIIIQNQVVGAREGIDVYLECNTEAHPPSTNHWYRDHEKVEHRSTRYQTHLTRNSYTTYMKLTIRNLQPEDYGSYQCVAKNNISETQGSIRLYRPPVMSTSQTSEASTAVVIPRKAITVDVVTPKIAKEEIRRTNTNTPERQEKYNHDRDNSEDNSSFSLQSETSCTLSLSVLQMLWILHTWCR